MAGKRGKRKGKSTGDLTNINPALIPKAAFTVVPRTPAPQPQPTVGLGGSQEVLNASLLGRSPPPDASQDDEPFSDPESSLYDYQVMEEPGYSSVEMLSLSRKRRSMGEREPASIPHGRPEHDIEDYQRERVIQALDAPELQRDPSALYSVPVKKGQRESSSSVPPSLRTTTHEYTEALKAVRDMSSEEELGDTVQRSRRLRKRSVDLSIWALQELAKVQVHRQTKSGENRLSARSLHFPVEHETGLKERASSAPFDTSGSARNGNPRTPREVPVKEEIIQASTSGQQKSQQSEPVSARSRISYSARSVSMAEDRVRALEAEKDHLTTLTQQLENEVHSYREMVSTFESGESENAQSLLLKKQLNDLKEENESLKSSVHRLSVELSSYQAKYRPINPEQTGDILGLPTRGPVPSWMPKHGDPHADTPIIRELNIRYLNPLFLAYDDRLKERDEAIKQFQVDIENLRQRTQEIIKENEHLHLRLEQTGSGPADITEWETMKDNARLVLEENQNLLEQINVKDNKAYDLHQAHVKEVNKMTKQLVLANSEKAEVEKELDEVRQKFRALKQKHEKLVLDSEGHMTQEDHINKMAELKRMIGEQEEVYKQELDSINAKLQAVQIERKTLSNQLVDASAENRRLQAEVKVMHRSVRKAQQKMMLLQRAIEVSENKEMSVQEYLSKVIKVAEESALERDKYEKAAEEHAVEAKKAMKKFLLGSMTVGKMEEKLKLYKMKAAARIKTVAERLKGQDELFNNQKKEYEREITHLRLLVKEKEELLQTVFTDKREVEEELEAMWQAANSENARIRDELRKSILKLRQHAGLSEAIDAHEKLESLHVTSDEEAVS